MGNWIDPALLDPNLIYVALVAGLWIGVTATYIPGTGIAEVLATILLVGSIALLTLLPVNWLAVGLIGIGIAAYLIWPFVDERYGRFADIGLVLQAIGGFFLFSGSELSVAPALIALSVLLAFAYNHLILQPTVRNQQRYNEYDASNEVIGIRGRVVKTLDPVGTVYVNKELWRARTTGDTMEKDTPIRVIAQEGLELIVEKAKRDDAPDYVHEAQDAFDIEPAQRLNGQNGHHES